MMSTGGFSGVVRISNMSDFIEPSQNCILPLQGETKNSERKLVGIHSRVEGGANATHHKRVKVSLNDCLACSGCVTTAETVLIESQTVEQMLNGMATSKCSVVAVAPQTVCSLAARFEKSTSQMAIILARYFKSLNANFVIETSFARILSRRLHYEEFHSEFIKPSGLGSRKTILAGVCPGFVCYAEKTHGDLLVPLLSRVRSPQAITGRLIKDYLATKHNIAPSDLFLVCVQPCFDKKLEASRPDFSTGSDGQEVDCVVTPIELEPLLAQFLQTAELENARQVSVLPEELCVEENWLSSLERGRLLGEKDAETSGGYANYIVQRLCEEYPNSVVKEEKIAKDFHVWNVEFGEETGGQWVSIAKAYGFRNIQNLVQRLKRERLRMHFVEVMACPSGCANGGGQLRAETGEKRNQIGERVRELYAGLGSAEVERRDGEADWVRIEGAWTGSSAGGGGWREGTMHTAYRPIKATQSSLVGNW